MKNLNEHELLDILINLKKLITISLKIKKIDEKYDITQIISNRKIYLDKMICLLSIEENIDQQNTNINLDLDENIDQQNTNLDIDEKNLKSKIDSMSQIFGIEQTRQSSDINPVLFENFGNGLAKLISGDILGMKNFKQELQNNIPSIPSIPSISSISKNIDNNIEDNLKKNENFTFNITKKVKNG